MNKKINMSFNELNLTGTLNANMFLTCSEATPGYDTMTGSGGMREGNTSENIPGANNLDSHICSHRPISAFTVSPMFPFIPLQVLFSQPSLFYLF